MYQGEQGAHNMSGLDKAFGVSPQVLALRTQKLNLLSANIANASTPDYKARDIDFRRHSALRRRGNSGKKPATLRGGGRKALPLQKRPIALQHLLTRTRLI